MNKNILIIGAGLSGLTIARILAENGFEVTIVEARNHIAGNCFDYMDDNGFLIHKYGPHLFHTSSEKAWKFVSQYSNWIEYKHKVRALLADGTYVTLPVNKNTAQIVGKENVIDIFFRPYTRKMWNLDLEEVSPDILKRVPIRDDENELYFPNDIYQALPEEGYTNLCKNIINHPNIKVFLNSKFVRNPGIEDNYIKIFNSMPIDEYYDFCYGKLPYRSIKFHLQTINAERLLPVATINFTNDGPYTRMTEWKLIPNCKVTPKNKYITAITVEEPCYDYENNMERYYPINDKDGINQEKYNRYKSIGNEKIEFIGRCGTYKYINMDKAFDLAIGIAEKFLNEK